MFRMNNRGFALVETLVVTVFVATIFTLIYTNFFPMFGEYERREGYDDIDSVYKTYLLKRMFENTSFQKDQYISQLNGSKHYVTLFKKGDVVNTTCNSFFNEPDKQNYCTSVLTNIEIKNIYLTKYNITELRDQVKKGTVSETEMDSQMQEYINSSPNYIKVPEGINYRIIVQYITTINKESANNSKTVYSFSTIGVKL